MAIVPASIRNKNPGAQYPGTSSKKFGSVSYETLTSKDGVHKIATFPTHVHGVAAMFDLLERSYTGMTVQAAITKWCGGYYVNTYTKVLEDKAGVKSTDVVTTTMIRDPARAIPLCKAMAFQEAGREYPLDDAGWQDGHAMAFAGGSVAPAFAPDNDVPSPKPETRAAAVRAWWLRVTGWGSAGTAGLIGIVEPAYKGATDTITALKDLGPLKSAFIEAGANTRAIGLGILVAAIVKVLSSYAKGT